MKNTCYVAVDKDGTEKISNSIMVRRSICKSVLWGLIRVRYSKNKRNKWADTWSSNESDAMPFRGVILPKGSIRRLLGGKDLTWDEDPVKLPEVLRNPVIMWESGETPDVPGPQFEKGQTATECTRFPAREIEIIDVEWSEQDGTYRYFYLDEEGNKRFAYATQLISVL